MFNKIFPVTTDFFNYFDQQGELLTQAAASLSTMIQSKPEEHIQQALEIETLESKGDSITHQCIESLHKTFITPFERDDIYRLTTKLDDIIDFIEDISARVVLYKMDTSGSQEIAQLVDVLIAAIQDVQAILTGLRQDKYLKPTHPAFSHIHLKENEGDQIVRQAIGKLFDQEKDPIKLIKWKEIYELLEEAIDHCEAVANIVEGVLIENS